MSVVLIFQLIAKEENMPRNILRVTLTVVGLISHFVMRLSGKKYDLNVIRAMWWNGQTLKRVHKVGAKLDKRASEDEGYIHRHEALHKKICSFRGMAIVRQDMDMV
jgi:hypothetical protein